MIKPEWVFMGTNFGLGYTDEAFQLESPGFHIVHMEPAAYDRLECHHEHAAFDGTFTQFYPPLRTLALDRAEAAASP